ncbi:MAG: response regulator transcription factor [Anaerolineae bacterium]
MTRVLIVDDQPAFRRQLGRLLRQAGLSVVAEAGGIPEAELEVCTEKPDLAVVGLMLPGVDGIEGIARLKAVHSELRVILVSVAREHAEVLRAAAVDAGAEGFVPKDDPDLERVRRWKSRGYPEVSIDRSVCDWK